MSWQDYVDKTLLGSKVITRACIVGLDGTTWATSEGFSVSKAEALKLVAGFDNKSLLQSEGIYIAEKRFVYLSGEDRIIRAKSPKVGLHCMKCNQAVLIGVYDDPIQPQQAAQVVEKLGDYLIEQGY